MDNFLREIVFAIPRGMSSAIAPSALDDTQVAQLFNVSIRGGLPRSRPRFLTYAPQLGAIVANGVFQGAKTYRLNSADRVIFCVSGVVYGLNLATGEVKTYATFPTTTFFRAYFQQVDRYFVIQNGITAPTENWPVILHEDTVINNLDTEVLVGSANFDKLSEFVSPRPPESVRLPIGTAMAYGHGRLFVAVDRVWDDGVISGRTPGWQSNLGRRFIVAGTVLKPDNVQEVLAFTEDTYLNDGGAFSLPAELGYIASMDFFRNSATGSGLGALVVLAREGSAAYAVNSPRSQWKNIDIGQVLFFNSGSESPWTLFPVNDDLVYRGRDGLRTIQYTRASETGGSGSLSNVPYSTEVNNYFDRDSRAVLPFVSGAYADSRVYTLAGGAVQSDGSCLFDSMVVLNTATLTAIESPPTKGYEGSWGGPQYYAVLAARMSDVDTVFFFYKDRDSGALKLGYISQNPANVLDFSSHSPVCRLYTREYVFKSPVVVKSVELTDWWLSGVVGNLSMTVYWRRGGEQVWHALGSKTVCVTAGSIPVAFNQLRFARDKETQGPCDPVNNQDVCLGNTFQFCIEWRGVATSERTIFAANALADRYNSEISCDADGACVSLSEDSLSRVLDDTEDYQI